MALSMIQSGIGYGGLVGGTSAVLGWVQNKIGINQWIKPYDSSYVHPLFKEALALAAPTVVVELGVRTVEEIDGNSTKLQSSYPFAFKMTVIALRTFAFVKVAEAFSNHYMPIHQKFIYQAAALYALGVFNPALVTTAPLIAGAVGCVTGISLGGSSWFSKNIFGDRVFQWFDPTYVSPSFKTGFTFGAVAIAVGVYATIVLQTLDLESIKIQKKQPKVWTIIDATTTIVVVAMVAEVMKKNNYQIHQIVINQLVVGLSMNLAKDLSKSSSEDEASR